jgi:hypothetical protein
MEDKPTTFNDLTKNEKEIIFLIREMSPKAVDRIMQQVHKQTTRQ